MKLSDYWDLLNQHDWFYDYSDDFQVWRRGQAQKDELLRLAKESPEHDKLYMDFRKFYFAGDRTGLSKPERPEEPS